MPLPNRRFGTIRSNVMALVIGGTLGLPATALADGVDRWTGPYGGLVLGYGSGTAKSGAAGTPGSTTRACNVGGTTYALGQGGAFAAGSFITQFAALPGVGADVTQHPNPGQFIPVAGFGLVPVGPVSTAQIISNINGLSGDQRTDTVAVQPLSYGTAGTLALDFAGTSSDLTDCVILRPVSNVTVFGGMVEPVEEPGVVVSYPADTVALLYGNGIALQKGGREVGSYVDVPDGSDGTAQNASLSGGTFGVLAGQNWALGGNVVGGIEGRLLATDIATGNGAVKVSGLAMIGGRIGLAQANTFVYLSGGLAVGSVNVTGGSGSGAGYAVGSGIEYGLSENTSLRLDVTYFDLGQRDYGVGDNTSVDFTVTSVGITMWF